MARIAGMLYLGIFVTFGFAEFLARGRLVVPGDRAATAANILAHESLYRFGGAAYLLSFVFDTALALLFYELLKPVSTSLSLLSAFFRLMHVAISTVATLSDFAPLTFLAGAQGVNAFNAQQLQQLAQVSLRLHTLGYTAALLFFGFACVCLGYLIIRSTFLPRLLGVLMALAGLCYVGNSFASFVAPAFARPILPWVLLLTGVPAELGLTVWLLVKGVNAERWREQASGGAGSLPSRPFDT